MTDNTGRLEQDSHKDRLFTRNMLASATGEIFWGLGLPVVIESTFLQVFLNSLGASSLVIGLIPSFFFIGTTFFGILSGYLTGHLERKRTIIVMTHLFGSLPIPVFGLIFLITGVTSSSLTLFMVMYGFFSLGIGLILPIWQNYLTMLFSDRKIFSALAGIMLAQSIARVVCSFAILRVVRQFSMNPAASAIIFLSVGALFLTGTLFYLFTIEVRDTHRPAERQDRFLPHLLHTAREIAGHRHYIRYLLSDIETYGTIGMVSFYAVYAVEKTAVSQAAASGLFVVFIYLGYAAVYIAMGWFNLLTLKRKLLFGKVASLAAALLLLTFSSLYAFIGVSFLLGIARGIRMLSYPPAVKRFSGRGDATFYFSLSPLFLLPISAGLPVINGVLIDRLPFSGAWPYKSVFVLMTVLVVLGLVFLLRTRFPEDKGSELVDQH